MSFAFILIGRSGCGKGTQADLLKAELVKKDSKPVLYIETGENFRNFIKEGGLANKLSLGIYEKDELQPSFIAAYMWTQELIEKYTGEQNLVFDGTPRTLDEAKMLTSAFGFYKIAKPVVLYLDVSREWSEKHLLARGRFDDSNRERIDKRLDWFDKDVMPAVEYFRTNDSYTFLPINGEQPIEKVHVDMMEGALPLLKQ